MQKYLDIFVNDTAGYANYLWYEITHPSFKNYFYWLIAVSLIFLILEVLIPWRKNQKFIRKDFFLDAFYMFFNFFIFSLIIYNGASSVVVNLFNDGIKAISGGFDLQALNPMNSWPIWAVLLTGFLVRDFVQWWIHRLLHKFEWLWQFHKVHHSVEEMGFAAHLRFHWMETVVYRTLEYIPLALLGIGLHDFFIIHIFTLSWGHFNHSNISLDGKITGGIVGVLVGTILANNLLDITIIQEPTIVSSSLILLACIAIGAFALGPFMKKLFNSPEMHIWHHSLELPEDRHTGINFGLTLAIWDYIFGTAYVPHSGRDIPLGFPGIESFPQSFANQTLIGVKKSSGVAGQRTVD